jgi:DNA-binding response OmpR family regulator
MGVIEDSIFAVYRKALESGDMEQASHAVDLVKLLREKIDVWGFQDHTLSNPPETFAGTFFEPFPYRYYEHESIVVIEKSAILLTKSENRLFQLFSSNETQGTDVKVITRKMIREHLWDQNHKSYNALRLAILRLRNKIEPLPDKPRVLLNYYKQGYLFLGKRLFD